MKAPRELNMSRRTWYRQNRDRTGTGTTLSAAIFLSSEDRTVPVERKMEIERPKAAPPKAANGGYPSSQTATTMAADRYEALPLELRLLALGLPMPESLAVAA
jgi:hypothetical protein